MSSNQERRIIPRVQLDSPITAKVATTKVTLVDISMDGARIEHPFPLKRGKQISLEFECEGSRILLACDVVRCTFVKNEEGATYCSGLRFSEESNPSIVDLNHLVSSVVTRDLDARYAVLRIR